MSSPTPRFRVGDRVQRAEPRSYLFPGVVIGVSRKLDGKTTLYTVECIAPGVKGMAHEFTEKALEPLNEALFAQTMTKRGGLSAAALAPLIALARSTIASRTADQRIGDSYLHRWFLAPCNPNANLYLHHFLSSDPDVMHDHPWNSTSIILEGSYIEVTPVGEFLREPGTITTRKATDAHRIIVPGEPVLSLFFTGPKVREWGFHCPKGWIHWEEFHAIKDNTRGIAGCGERD